MRFQTISTLLLCLALFVNGTAGARMVVLYDSAAYQGNRHYIDGNPNDCRGLAATPVGSMSTITTDQLVCVAFFDQYACQGNFLGHACANNTDLSSVLGNKVPPRSLVFH